MVTLIAAPAVSSSGGAGDEPSEDGPPSAVDEAVECALDLAVERELDLAAAARALAEKHTSKELQTLAR